MFFRCVKCKNKKDSLCLSTPHRRTSERENHDDDARRRKNADGGAHVAAGELGPSAGVVRVAAVQRLLRRGLVVLEGEAASSGVRRRRPRVAYEWCVISAVFSSRLWEKKTKTILTQPSPSFPRDYYSQATPSPRRRSSRVLAPVSAARWRRISPRWASTSSSRAAHSPR